MLTRFATTGTTIEEEKIKRRGDVLDFDVEKSLLMASPGNLNPKLHRKLLERVHHARPNLLSKDFVRA